MGKINFDYHLLLVNPPSLTREPGFGSVGTVFVPEKIKAVAMNPGILSIASYLRTKGVDLKIIDLSVDNDYGKLRKLLAKEKPMVIGISSQCGFDYLESLECLKIARKESPASLTIVGGQHVGPLGRTAFSDTENLDVLVKYEGEIVLEEILKRRKRREGFRGIPGIIYKKNGKLFENPDYPPFVDLDKMPPLEYEIYPDYLKFTPFIEESRGCCFGCKFCTSSFCNKGMIRIKSAKKFLEELERVCSIYGSDKFYAVLAATFGLNPKNTLEIAKGMKRYKIKWTTEIRIDLSWEKYINQLYEAGLEVLTTGMESASPKILSYMNKTKDPVHYINKASKLVKVTSKFRDFSLRINYMMYVGETPQTLRKTVNFLSKNCYGIDSILYSLILATPETPLLKEFDYFRKKYGSKIYHSEYWDNIHMHPCQPSKYFTTEEAAYFCSAMEKIFSSKEGWYKAEKAHYSQKTEKEIHKVKKELIKSRFKGV